MLSEELQKLVEASLTDGVLTDKERAIIRKRALLEGVDPDEVDLLLDSEVQKIQQQKQKDVAKVRKCPNCGAIISGLEVVCPDCGYKLSGEIVSSAQKLADKINEIMTSNDPMYLEVVKRKYNGGDGEEVIKIGEKRREKAINKLVDSFPIPNTEEDLFEFLLMMRSSGYNSKYRECISRAKLLFPNSPKIKEIIEKQEEEDRKREEEDKKFYRGCLIACIIVGAIIIIGITLGVIFDS
jgi:hypothetical protein